MKSRLLFCLFFSSTIYLFAQADQSVKKLAHYLNLEKVSPDTLALWTSWILKAENESEAYDIRVENWRKLMFSIERVMEGGGRGTARNININWSKAAVAQNIKLSKLGQGNIKTTPLGKLGAVQKFGQGSQAIILIPPIGHNWEVYQNIIDVYQSSYTIYAITLAGFGNTAPYPLPSKRKFSEQQWLKSTKDALKTLISQENLNDFYLLGTGLMAYLPLQIALDMPDKVAGVISVNGQINQPVFSRKKPGQQADIKERKSIADHSFPSEYLVPTRFSIPPGDPTRLLQDVTQANKLIAKANSQTNSLTFQQYNNELRTIDLSEALAQLQVPVLALCSRRDDISNWYGFDFSLLQWTQLQILHPKAPIQIELFDNQRDFLFMEEWNKLNPIIHAFLKKPTLSLESQLEIPGGGIATVSPKAILTQAIANTTVQIKYHRPSVKGRPIFGKLVPYGIPWRAGANQATEISFNQDVLVNDQLLEKGIYSLFVLPEAEKWTFIFSKVLGQWGNFFYHPKYDHLKVEAKVDSIPLEEWLKFDIENLSSNSADLVLKWEHSKATLSIKEAFQLPVTPQNLLSADWEKIITDKEGDLQNPGMSDAKALHFYHDKSADILWFKFELYNEMNKSAAAMNLLFDIDANQNTGTNWFGTNTQFTFERMATLWIRREKDSYGGINGIADAHGVQTTNWTSMSSNSVKYYLDKELNAYFIGIKRKDLHPDLKEFNVIGAVGEYFTWNDDISEEGFATIVLED